MSSLQNRVIGALSLQSSTFEEIRLDAAALQQAVVLVAAVAVARGIGSAWGGLSSIMVTIIMTMLGWAVWSACVWLVGTKLMPGRHAQADIAQVARTIGFAQAPGLGGVLGIIPILGWLIGFALGIWVLVASVVAVKQVFGYDDYVKTIVTCVIAAVPAFIIMMAIVIPLGIGMWVSGGM